MASKQQAQDEIESLSLRHILDALQESLFVFDMQGRISVSNRSCHTLTAYSNDELRSLNIDDLLDITSDDASSLVGLIQAGKKLDGVDGFIVTKGREMIAVSISVTQIEFNAGGELVYVGVATDMRQKRELEKEKNSVKRQLLQSQKLESIGKLAGGVAHDFNNILGGILGHAYMLQDSFPEVGKVRQRLDIIITATERGAKLTNQLLGFAREGKYENTDINLHEAIQEAIDLLSRTLPKSIRMSQSLVHELWLTTGDATQIQQILMNLGVNARDAMPKGGSLIYETDHVTVRAQDQAKLNNLAPGEYIRLSVADTGTGMHEAIQHKIFDPFFTTKDVGKGSGLGLSMVYGIMQNHGGVIVLDSSYRHGARFCLYFPKRSIEALQNVA